MSNKGQNFDNRTGAFTSVRMPIAPPTDIIIPKTRYKRERFNTDDLMHLSDCICDECCKEDGLGDMQWY